MSLSYFNVYQQLTSARLVSTSNVSGTYQNGALNNGVGATLTVAASSLTIDSVAVEVGNRVLLQNQSSANQNGVYNVVSIGSTVVLQRSQDLQCNEQLTTGLFICIGAGTLNAGACFVVVEPLPAVLGINNLVFAASPLNSALGTMSTQAANNVAITGGTAVFNNTGLSIKDSNASHNLNITTSSDLTANRSLTFVTGDASRTLDISAANVTISSYGSSLIDDTSKLNALTTLGVKRGTTGAYGGGGTSNAFTATGLLSTDIVVASILTSTNAVSIAKVVPTADTLTITFSADPGAATTLNWIAIATV